MTIWTLMAKLSSNASNPFATALRLLTRRDRSEAELRQKLQQFGFCTSAIDETINKCREYNYLDDQRYAKERARSFMRNGRGVGQKIRQDLRRRGINEALTEQAIENAEAEFSSDQILRDQLSRRFPSFHYARADDRERRRVISFFQRRGFPLEQIFAIVKSQNAPPPV